MHVPLNHRFTALLLIIPDIENARIWIPQFLHVMRHTYDCLISVDWRHCRLPPRQLVTLTPELCQGTVDQHLTMVILGLTNRSLINQP